MFKKFITVLLVVAVYFFAFYTVPVSKAESPEKDGGDIIFKDTKKLKHVLFSHSKHKKAKNKCEDCHDKIFKQKTGSSDEGNAITMKTMKKGQFCGTCHNGKKAFKVASKCKKCHSVAK